MSSCRGSPAGGRCRLRSGGDDLCRHELLHEAVERYLKGYLISRGWALRRTHDLSDLLSAAIAYDPSLEVFGPLADNLTDQFWAQHYPGGDLSEVGADYAQVREEAGKLIALISHAL